MAKRTGTSVRKSRYIRSKHLRNHGKFSIAKYLQEYDVGEKVLLHIEPAVQEGFYHRRFFGRSGEIVAKQGSCYVVKIKDQKSTKKIVVHPVHLRRL